VNSAGDSSRLDDRKRSPRPIEQAETEAENSIIYHYGYRPVPASRWSGAVHLGAMSVAVIACASFVIGGMVAGTSGPATAILLAAPVPLAGFIWAVTLSHYQRNQRLTHSSRSSARTTSIGLSAASTREGCDGDSPLKPSAP
jgi:hypothetical protein